MGKRSSRGMTTYLLVAATLVLVGISALAVLSLNGQLSSAKTDYKSNSTTSTSNRNPPGVQVQARVQEFISDFSQKDAGALQNFYTNQSVVSWSGLAPGQLVGNYTGTGSIGILYSAFLGSMSSFSAHTIPSNISLINETVQTFPNKTIVSVSYEVAWNGAMGPTAGWNASAKVTQEWLETQAGGSDWLIIHDSWDYFHGCYPELYGSGWMGYTCP